MTIYTIEKVVEDPYMIEFARKMKYDLKWVRKIVEKYDLGYIRKGAGYYVFLSPEDQEIITKHYKLKQKNASRKNTSHSRSNVS